MPAMVYYLCPFTDESVATGITAGLADLAAIVRRGTGFSCTACGAKHILSDEETWLSLTGAIPLSRARPRKR